MIEHEIGKKLRKLISDNGVEYTSREFDAYCNRQRKSTLKDCSRSERVNQEIMDKVRSMTYMTKLPKLFWANCVA